MVACRGGVGKCLQHREPTLDKSKKSYIKPERNRYFFNILYFETEMAYKISELSEKNEE
jgi:hypothetical protein